MLWVAFVADIVAVLVLVVSWRSGRAIASSSKAVRRHLDRQLTPNPDRVSNATAAPAGTMDPSMRRAIDTLKVVSDLERCASVAEASARLEAAKASADEPHAGNTRSSITLASVAVGAVALAIVPLVLLNIEIVRARTDIGFAGHEIVANARTAQALGPCSEPLNPHPNELDLTIGRADPVGGSIDLTAALCVTQDTLLHLESVPLVALTNAWIACEGMLGDLLRTFLDSTADRIVEGGTGGARKFMNSKRREFFARGEWTIRHTVELLSIVDVLPFRLYHDALDGAKARNNWVHYETVPHSDAASKAIRLAGELFSLLEGIDLHVLGKPGGNRGEP